ncbi:unnamed protein product, partial [Laminaria digitata]
PGRAPGSSSVSGSGNVSRGGGVAASVDSPLGETACTAGTVGAVAAVESTDGQVVPTTASTPSRDHTSAQRATVSADNSGGAGPVENKTTTKHEKHDQDEGKDKTEDMDKREGNDMAESKATVEGNDKGDGKGGEGSSAAAAAAATGTGAT